MLFKRPKVYVEIGRDSLLIGKLHLRGDFFYCEQTKEVCLPGLVCDDVIYKISFLSDVVKTFVIENRLVGKTAVVCLPNITFLSAQRRNLLVFQTTLCLCKAGLKIYMVCGGKLEAKGSGEITLPQR